MPNATQAQKEERRRRFFAAISKDSSPPQQQQSSKSETKSNSTSKKSAFNSSSSIPSSSTSTSSSPFSAATTEKLKAVERDILAHPEQLQLPDENFIIPREIIIAHMQKFLSTHPEELPPEFRQGQRERWASQDALEELRATPLEQVPAELKDLKRKITAFDAQVPEEPGKQHMRRVNELLRADGEHEFPFEALAACPPGNTAKAWEIETEARARLRDLKKRKPKLHATIISLCNAIVAETPPDLELKFANNFTWDKPHFVTTFKPTGP